MFFLRKTSTIHISNFCSGMPPGKVHELAFLWFGLPGPVLIYGKSPYGKRPPPTPDSLRGSTSMAPYRTILRYCRCNSISRRFRRKGGSFRGKRGLAPPPHPQIPCRQSRPPPPPFSWKTPPLPFSKTPHLLGEGEGGRGQGCPRGIWGWGGPFYREKEPPSAKTPFSRHTF